MDILKKIESILNYIINIVNVFSGRTKEEKQKKNQILNKKCNDDIENGKSTQFSDSLRKDKQQQIEALKNVQH